MLGRAPSSNFKFVCRRCQRTIFCSGSRRRQAHLGNDNLLRRSGGDVRYAHSSTTSSPSSPSRLYQAAKLTSRRLISVQGRDAAKFLHGLTTNNVIAGGQTTTGFYSAFLTAQGRVLNDVFIYPAAHSRPFTDTLPAQLDRSDPAYLIEVDAAEAAKLLKHVSRYKLRASVSMRLLDAAEWSVWSIWAQEHDNSRGGGANHAAVPQESLGADPFFDGLLHSALAAHARNGISCVDSRAPGMGGRIVLPGSTAAATAASKIGEELRLPSASTNSYNSSSPADDGASGVSGGGGGGGITAAEVEEVPFDAYTVRRMLRGVPEGQREIWSETAFAAESNIDYMGGVDFRKGCYVGQETVTRTQHTGVVRKRILPVQLYADGEPIPTALTYKPVAPPPPPPPSSQTKGGEKEQEENRMADDQPSSSPTAPSSVQQPPGGTSIFAIDAAAATSSSVGGSSNAAVAAKRKAGHWLDGIGNIGLALCRLGIMTEDASSSSSSTSPSTSASTAKGVREFGMEWLTLESARTHQLEGRARVRAFVPAWHFRSYHRLNPSSGR